MRWLDIHVHANGRRIDEVDKRPDGVFLFNFFSAAQVGEGAEEPLEILLGVWEYTAGWFTTRANLDNSTLLVPQEPSFYDVVNHCRWDSLVDIVPHLALRPSIKCFVLGNFTANGIVAMPVLYRVAGSNGVVRRRPVGGWLTIAIGVLHSVATLPALVDAWAWIGPRGAWGGVSMAVPPPQEAMGALAALFSVVVGVLLLVTGGLLIRLHRARIARPIWVGPAFLLTGLVGGVLMPPTGFWTIAGLGLWMTLSSRQHAARG